MSAEQGRLEAYRDELVETVRDVGAQAALNFDGDWRTDAARAIRELARSRQVFTAEDVRARAGDPTSPSAMGCALLTAAAEGTIEAVGFKKAARIQRHGAWVRTWKGRVT